jgi:Ca2+-binding EF-hand superfamily protein
MKGLKLNAQEKLHGKLTAAFQCIDLDSSGRLGLDELKVICKILGVVTEELRQSLNWDADNSIGLQDFLHGMSDLIDANKRDHSVGSGNSLDESKLDRLLAVRSAFDHADTDGDGFIQFDELKTMIVRMGRTVSDEELQQISHSLDTDDSGTIEWVEFLHALGGEGGMQLLGSQADGQLDMPNISVTRGGADMMHANAIWFNYVQNCVVQQRDKYAEHEGKPDKEKAEEYFKNVIQPKRILDKRSGKWRLSVPGEAGAQFPLYSTKSSAFFDWGLGEGLYFSNVKWMTAFLFLVGMMNLPTASYYSSSDYSPFTQGAVNWKMRGSAVCTDQREVTVIGGTNSTLQGCPLSLQQGIMDIGSTILFYIMVTIFSHWQDAKREKMDIAVQTAQDYSICIHDPDHDALDPDEWRAFFGQWGDVAVVTIAINNGRLLETVANRLEIKKQIEMHEREHQTHQKFLRCIKGMPKPLRLLANRLGFGRDIAFWGAELFKNEATLLSLLHGQYQACKVFVSFATETGQRDCLTDLCTGTLNAMMDTAPTWCAGLFKPVPKCNKFRGTNVLEVSESAEPHDVIWENIGRVSGMRKFIQQVIVSFYCIMLVGVFTLGSQVVHESYGIVAASVFIEVVNMFLPEMVFPVMETYEKHEHHSSQQQSVMIKLILTQLANISSVIYFATPFKETIRQERMYQIQSILWVHATLVPLLELIEIRRVFGEVVLSRYATTQRKMNSYFDGERIGYAQKYAELVITVFVSLVWSALLPTAVLFGTAALFMKYWVEKRALLRGLWQRVPHVDDGMASTARSFITAIVVLHLSATNLFYAGWPFDDVCVMGNGTYFTCNKKPEVWNTQFFWPEITDWMPETQALIVLIYRVVTVSGVVYIVIEGLGRAIVSILRGTYEAVGKAMLDNFREVPGMQAYVPLCQDKSAGTTPMLACDMGRIDSKYFHWVGDYKCDNLFVEVDALNQLDPDDLRDCFSRCRQFKESEWDKKDGVVVAAVGAATARWLLKGKMARAPTGTSTAEVQEQREAKRENHRLFEAEIQRQILGEGAAVQLTVQAATKAAEQSATPAVALESVLTPLQQQQRQEIDVLMREMEVAAGSKDFGRAHTIQQEIDQLKETHRQQQDGPLANHQQQLDTLRREMEAAAESKDFSHAHTIQQEIDQLKETHRQQQPDPLLRKQIEQKGKLAHEMEVAAEARDFGRAHAIQQQIDQLEATYQQERAALDGMTPSEMKQLADLQSQMDAAAAAGDFEKASALQRELADVETRAVLGNAAPVVILEPTAESVVQLLTPAATQALKTAGVSTDASTTSTPVPEWASPPQESRKPLKITHSFRVVDASYDNLVKEPKSPRPVAPAKAPLVRNTSARHSSFHPAPEQGSRHARGTQLAVAALEPPAPSKSPMSASRQIVLGDKARILV